MRWILLDVVLAALALGLLVIVGLSLWRRVKALGKAVGAAGTQLAAMTAQLDTLSDRERPSSGRVSQAPRPRRGVGSTRSS